MPTIQQTLPQVTAFNTEEYPFSYAVQGSIIIGTWDITNSRWFAPLGVTDIFQKYSLTISFDEQKGTFSVHETKAESKKQLGIGLDGVSFSMGSDAFSGKMNQKSLFIGVGGEKDGSNGTGVNTIAFNTKRIKQPLFTLLEGLGWKQKKGFLGGLFS
jgi:hypothetical protein